jgi:hypothetical protein
MGYKKVIKCLKHDFTNKTGRDDPLVACGNNGPVGNTKGQWNPKTKLKIQVWSCKFMQHKRKKE